MKFKVGDEVLCRGYSFCPCKGIIRRKTGGLYRIKILDGSFYAQSRLWNFNEKEIELFKREEIIYG